jgi:hypothetical protein
MALYASQEKKKPKALLLAVTYFFYTILKQNSLFIITGFYGV